MARWMTNAPEDYDYNRVVKTLRVIGPMEGQRGTWREIEVLDEERFRAFQSPRYSSGWFVAYPADGADAKKLGLRGLRGGRLGSASTDTLWSELRIGKSARAEFWRRELSQKLFDYELGGKFASELRPVLRDTDVTPEQLAAFETDESEHLSEEFKGVIAALDDQITNAQDWQIVAYGDAFYAAAPGGNKTSGLRGTELLNVTDAHRSESRASIARKLAATRQRGEPLLTADSDSLDVLRWLARNDPNGEWRNLIQKKLNPAPAYADPDDEDVQRQEYFTDLEMPDDDELWAQVAEMISDS